MAASLGVSQWSGVELEVAERNELVGKCLSLEFGCWKPVRSPRELQ
jgi:hypothetical protein